VKFNESGKSFHGDDLIDFLRGSTKAIIALEKINEPILQALPELKLISKYGVGLDNIYFNDLQKHKVNLAWRGGVNKRSVAELALHFILGTVRGSFHSHHDIQSGNWYQFKGFNLTGKTVGLIGLGHVGQELVPMLKPFTVKILAYDIHDRKEYCALHGVTQVGLKELLQQSDVVTVHVPYTSKTKMLLSEENINLMKDESFLVNTARGGIVDEASLLKALQSKKITSAAFDVFKEEPFINEELKKLHNFYFTPHIGGSSIESIHAMGLAAIEGLDQGKEAIPSNFFDYEL
jgi:D-3-phosphoglycerate dehydrogenase